MTTADSDICAFCSKQREAVRYLIVAPDGAAICNECVAVCSDMLLVETPRSPASTESQRAPTVGVPRTITVNSNGSGDHTTIQEAVAAAAPGDVLQLADGLYFGSVLIDRPLTMQGSGSDHCWLSADVSDGCVIAVAGTSDIRIADLKIIGLGMSDLSTVSIDISSVTIDRCTIEDGGGFGIAVTGGSRVTVAETTVASCRAAGVAVGGSSEVTLRNCLVQKNVGSGVSSSGSQVVVLDSVIRKNGQAGIAISGKGAARVQNCEVTGNRRGGIVADGQSTIRLISNTVLGNVPAGVWVHGGSDAQIERTIVADNGSWGIDATGIGGINNAASAVSLNNCFWANGKDLTEGVDSALDLFTDPLIVTDHSGTPSLRQGSPCIGGARNGDNIGARAAFGSVDLAPPPPPEHLTHLRSLCLSFVSDPIISWRQAVDWMTAATAIGLTVPFGMVYDMGQLLGGRRRRPSIVRPRHVPPDDATQAYAALLQRIADHPVAQRLAASATTSNRLIALVLMRLFREVPFPEMYRLPTGDAGERFLNRLRGILNDAEPEQLWHDTPAAERPDTHALFSKMTCAAIEANLAALNLDELSFLEQLALGEADDESAGNLVRLLLLTEAEPNIRLSLAGARRLMRDLASQLGTDADRGDMPLGGYSAVTRRPSGGAMLLSELVYPRPLLMHRIANREALYYEHTRDRRPDSALAYIVVQAGYGLGGSGEILARALLLALAQHTTACSRQVRYSFAGHGLTAPEPLDGPSDILRALQHRETAIADGATTLSAVLGHLQEWRRAYPRREVLWIVSECFDADHADEHPELYHALEREAPQTAWIIPAGQQASSFPVDRMFPVRHRLDLEVLRRLAPARQPVPAHVTRRSEIDHGPL